MKYEITFESELEYLVEGYFFGTIKEKKIIKFIQKKYKKITEGEVYDLLYKLYDYMISYYLPEKKYFREFFIENFLKNLNELIK
jgi:hypothetical protein